MRGQAALLVGPIMAGQAAAPDGIQDGGKIRAPWFE